MKKIIILLLALTSCVGLSAQHKINYTKRDSLLFRHLSVGGSIGTTGIGVEVATSLNRHFAMRAGINVLATGNINIKLPVTNGQIQEFFDITDPDMGKAASEHNVNLNLKLKMITGDILVDYYPSKTKTFHITAGAYFGNRQVLHLHNKNAGDLKFLHEADKRVQDYNDCFGTNFNKVGLEFGDYVFTADDNGNLDVKMKEWAVRPYIGIGGGRSVSLTDKRKFHVNFDAGVQIWGAPKFKLNNEKTINSSNKDNGGVLNIVSALKVWPCIRLVFCGDIF